MKEGEEKKKNNKKKVIVMLLMLYKDSVFFLCFFNNVYISVISFKGSDDSFQYCMICISCLNAKKCIICLEIGHIIILRCRMSNEYRKAEHHQVDLW